MKKKLGLSIIVGVIILACVLGIVGIVYTTVGNVYAANTRDDFSFAKESNGKVREYSLELAESTSFNLILPQGANKNDVVISEGDSNKLLKIENNVVTGIKMGSGTLKATITIDGKKYETTTKYQIVDRDFRFPLENKMITEYVDDNAFIVGKEYTFNLKLPTGYSMDDVEYFEDDSKGLLQINDVDKSVTAKKVGKGVLFARIIGTEKYTSVNFEVIEKNSTSNNDNKKEEEKVNKEKNKKNNKSYKIEFSKDRRVTTYNGKDITFGALAPIKSGMKSTDIKWTSSNQNVAQIKDATGQLTIKGTGETTITASYEEGGVEDSYTLTVYPQNIKAIDFKENKDITNTTITLNVGDTLQTFMKDDNSRIDDSKITFGTSNSKVCKVDESGNLTAVSKGTATIKGMLNDSNKTKGEFKVKVVGSQDDKIASGNFTFPIDSKTNKPIEYIGDNSIVVGDNLKIDMVKPQGAENYQVEYTCSNKNLLNINDNNITAMNAGSGTLTAKMKIGTKTKTAKTKIEVFENKEEKEKAKGEEVKYINISFDKEIMAIEVGNTITLKPEIETNMAKKDYTLEYKASTDGIVELNEKTGRVKPIKAGTVDITVSVKENPNINSKITLDIQDKVVLVSKLQLATDLPKRGSTYQIQANQAYEFNFDVLPDTATLKDYALEVEDNDNFIVNGKMVTALKAGVKTKLTAKSLDSGNKKSTITIESVVSDSELETLQPILENKDITVKVGETLNFRNVQNTSNKVTITKTSNNAFTIKYDDDMVSITGKKEGKGNITVKYGKDKISIPVNIEKNVTKKDDIDDVPVTDILFPIDPNTSKTKDYVNDYQFEVGQCYQVSQGVTVLPLGATNKDVEVKVSDNSAFTVTTEGNVIANKPNKTAVLTVNSISNPEVSTSIRLSSVEPTIKSISFPRKYIGEYKYDINDNNYPWAFGMIITTTDNKTYNPLNDYSLLENEEYKKLRDQLVITSNSPAISIKNNTAYPIEGVNGNGTLTAYVRSNPSIKATTPFEIVGIDKNVKISSVKFAQDTYNLSLEEYSTSFCPIITLNNGYTLDSRSEKVRNSAEYKSYLSQLQSVKIAGLKNGYNSTGELLSIVRPNEGLIIEMGYAGTCEIGVAFKGSSNVLAKTKLVITEKEEEAAENDKAIIEEVDHATTTTNKNLKIQNIQFSQRSYELDEDYAWAFKPIIELSDGTKLSSQSANQDVYLYYLGLTELFLTNDNNSSEVDFGVAEVSNKKVPREVIPLKNGKITLAVGVKSTGITYDRIPITVKLKNK